MKKFLGIILILIISLVLFINISNVSAEEGISYLDFSGEKKIVTDAILVTSTDTTLGTSSQTSWYYVSDEVTISDSLKIYGNCNLILTSGANLIANNGISIGASSTFIVYGDTLNEDTMGKLYAKSNTQYYAGIGGTTSVGSIVINGGKIEAIGGKSGAGIGVGGESRPTSIGSITINGGIVTTTGNVGIGTGSQYTVDKNIAVTINGGKIIATGNTGPAIGIGNLNSGSGSGSHYFNININGGEIIATSNSNAAIGVGNVVNKTGNREKIYMNLNMTGGIIKATKGSDAFNIWGYAEESIASVNLTNGIVYDITNKNINVFGNAILNEDLVLGEEDKLDIAKDAILTINDSYTLDMTLGEVSNNGTLIGNVVCSHKDMYKVKQTPEAERMEHIVYCGRCLRDEQIIECTIFGPTCTENACCSVCDFVYGPELDHIDLDTNHICDRDCGITDIGMNLHKDEDRNHQCDYGCPALFGTCEDVDLNHECDYGCEESFGNHLDANFDHECDYGCNELIGDCIDNDFDHQCDYGCSLEHGQHQDGEDKDHLCDYNCGDIADLGCYDLDNDLFCDECEIELSHKIGSYLYDKDGHWKECENKDCDHKTEKEEHKYGDWLILKEPTENEKGLRSKKCECGHEINEDIPVLEKESLHPIAITGIILGALSLLAGSFSLYWFVLRKRL